MWLEFDDIKMTKIFLFFQAHVTSLFIYFLSIKWTEGIISSFPWLLEKCVSVCILILPSQICSVSSLSSSAPDLLIKPTFFPYPLLGFRVTSVTFTPTQSNINSMTFVNGNLNVSKWNTFQRALLSVHQHLYLRKSI